MSVTAIADVSYESWGGYDDPRLPIKIWKALLILTGDASGGTINAFFRFNLAGVERLDNFFSLEEIYVDVRQALAVNVAVEARNFGSVKTGVRVAGWLLRVDTTQAGGAKMNSRDSTGIVPAFLGQQVFRSTPLELFMTYLNVDTIVSVIWVGGYVWGPRSASAKNGGILRPPSGLFSV